MFFISFISINESIFIAIVSTECIISPNWRSFLVELKVGHVYRSVYLRGEVFMTPFFNWLNTKVGKLLYFGVIVDICSKMC